MSNLEFLSFTKENKAKYLKNISMVLIPDEEFTGSILINKEKDELIGFGYLDTGYTNNVYIEPKYRHKGYGTLIMDQIMTKFKGNKIRVPKSLNLLDFYKKVGFTYVKQDSGYYYFDCPKGYLVEDTRTTQLNKSKEKGLYKNTKYGKNRYERKKYSKLASTVEEYNKIDMNDFFKKDILLVKIPITGETDNYTVKVKLLGVVAEMTKSIKSSKYKFEFKTVLQALTKVFNTTDVYTNCTCQDFCLHPDTQIKLLNGKTLSVEDLEKEFKNSKTPLYLYSVDEKGNFKPGKITNVWIRNYTDHMLKITLDNGKSIITTGEHPYMLRNGQYLPASELSIGQSLMPLYFGKTINGYETVKLNSASNTQFYSTYKQVADDLLQKEIEEAKIRSGETKIAIHHKDFNKDNNSPENLYPMGFEEHYKYHYDHVKESGALEKFRAAGEEYRELVKDHTTPEYEKQAKIMSDTMKAYWANLSDEEKERRSQISSRISKQAWADGKYNTEKRKAADELHKTTLHTPEMELKSKEGIRNYWKNLSGEEREKVIAQRKQNLEKGIGWNKGKHLSDKDKLHKSLAALNRTPEEKAEHNKKIRETKIYKVLNKMIEDKVDLTENNYEIYRLAYFPKSPKLDVQFNNINDAISYFKLNHKIIAIETIEYDMLQPVYDIEVENYHNFYVDAGVILHNCYRFAYWNIVNNVSIDDSAHNPGPGKGIANPDDDKGRGCKHILLVLENCDWLMKVASVIFNYVEYMSNKMPEVFLSVIFPRLYGIDAEEAQEQNIIPYNVDLKTAKDLVNIINKQSTNPVKREEKEDEEE